MEILEEISPKYDKVNYSVNCFLGYPPQTGTATLRIIVEDVNDNAPEFVLPHPPMVMELKDPPQFVITFSARDRDTPKYGSPFNFSLPPCDKNPTCKNGDLEFTMDFDPGKIAIQ